MIDRDLYFTAVRQDPFPGSLTQDQVDGQNAILDAWESVFPDGDLRWLAYALATTYHETSATMMPIEEYGNACLFEGMVEGWYRTHDDGKPETLARYFGPDVDDPYEAREIINGDKTKVPSWASGASIGELIASYHREFLMALQKAYVEETEDEPSPGRRLLAEARAKRQRG
jgi:hypothetical protein